MPLELPRIGIVPTPRFTGINNLTGEANFMEVLPYEEVFTNPFQTDVHFTTYEVLAHEKWPRLNKPVLPKIRTGGGDVLTNFLAFDYDNPDHAAWTKERYEALVEQLLTMDEEGFPLALGWTNFYTTRHGCRFVYVLSSPVPVETAETLHRGVVRDFQQWGLPMDTACSDWTRLFRAPFVMRKETPTWEDPFFEQLWNKDNRLDPADILPEVHAVRAKGTPMMGEVVELDIPKPPPEVAEVLLTNTTKGGKVVPTQWFRDAKRRLTNRESYPSLFEHRALALPGSRDVTIQRLVGEVVGLLYNLSGTSPELIYALFFQSLEQLEPDEDTYDWTDVGWRAVLRYWARETAKAEHEAQVEQDVQVAAQSISQRVVEGMRGWCHQPELAGNPDEAVRWAMEHLIAGTDKSFWVMTPAGVYDKLPVSKTMLASRIRELGMEPVIPLEEPREDGRGYRKVHVQHLIDEHGTSIDTIEGQIGKGGGVIRNMGRPDAVLCLPLFHLKNNLHPAFDTEVDIWLKKFGGDNYERLKEWIALALDFQAGPICALSIAGPPSCGKKLFMQGLAECINTEAIADAGEFGRFQSGVLRTPFLLINEGFPNLSKQIGAKDPADTFRHYISGDPILVERKFRDPIVVRNPLRIIFAANNLDVLQTLTGHRDLSPDDRVALALRLFHLDVGIEATDYLRYKGGLKYTGRDGSRWIKPDAGGLSDYVVAKHFLWLHHNERPSVPAGSRLLMEGEMEPELLRQMTTRSGSAPDVIESLVNMIEARGAPIAGLIVRAREIFVTSSAVLNYYRNGVGMKTSRNLTARSVSKILQGIVIPGDTTHARNLQLSDGTFKKARWRKLDPSMLFQEAIDHGYPCARLEEIVNAVDPIASMRHEIDSLPTTDQGT